MHRRDEVFGCDGCLPAALKSDFEHREFARRLEKAASTYGVAGGAVGSVRQNYITVPHIAADPDFAAVITECDRVLATKGRDYTQGEGRLKNFYRNGARLGIPARQVLGIYLNKHLDAIETFIKRGQVESEPIEGRIVDAINYLLLLAKMVREEGRSLSLSSAKTGVVSR